MIIMSKLTTKEKALDIAQRLKHAQSCSMFACFDGDMFLGKVLMNSGSFAAYHVFIQNKEVPEPSYQELKQACACEGLADAEMTGSTPRFNKFLKQLYTDGKFSVTRV